jgi:hypothetical protein
MPELSGKPIGPHYVTVLSVAAGGRPQAGLEVVEKLLTSIITRSCVVAADA